VEGQVLVRAGWGAIEQQTPRHAEMQQQRVLVVQVTQNVFGAPTEALDPAADQALGETLRQRKTQIGPALVERRDPATTQAGGQRAHGGLDLRQLRHGRTRWPRGALVGARALP
jgi:hypothetical protein